MVYNENCLLLTEIVMKNKGWIFRNIFIYLLLFLVSFMVFDSTTLMIGVCFALIALYHFSSKFARRKQL
jgi:hypothetical protein